MNALLGGRKLLIHPLVDRKSDRDATISRKFLCVYKQQKTCYFSMSLIDLKNNWNIRIIETKLRIEIQTVQVYDCNSSIDSRGI